MKIDLTSKFRSVHNTRIERAWYDITEGFGLKWANLFIELEAYHGLDPDLPSHIWLLHYLFLPAINEDANRWQATWNKHKLHIKGEPTQSPEQIFTQSIYHDGPRGFPQYEASNSDAEGSSTGFGTSIPFDLTNFIPDDTMEEDFATFGVDWDVLFNPRLMDHHQRFNHGERQEQEVDNPFDGNSTPEHLSEVKCDPPDSPLSDEQLEWLKYRLEHCGIDLDSRNPLIRMQVWIQALSFCKEIFSTS
jgi:hypothetical protein